MLLFFSLFPEQISARSASHILEVGSGRIAVNRTASIGECD
jgi:hypothetical protein